MELKFKYNELIVLAGPKNTGKSLFAKSKFPYQSFPSDFFRVLVADQSFQNSILETEEVDKDKERLELVSKNEFKNISEVAFESLRFLISQRAKLNKPSIVDATNLNLNDLKAYADIAKENNVFISLIFFNPPMERTLQLSSREESIKVKHQYRVMKDLLKNKKRINNIGINNIIELTETDFNSIEVSFERFNDLFIDLGNGLDIMGDGHGLLESRIKLIEQAGYVKNEDGIYRHPQGRKLVYLNDEMSKGHQTLDSVEYGEFPSIAMMNMMMKQVKAGEGYAVDSNHSYKIWRWLDGRNVQMRHGDELVVEEFEKFEEKYGFEKTKELQQELKIFLKNLPPHLVIEDRGVARAVVVHGGIQDDMIGKVTPAIRDYCRYGPEDGEKPDGTPNRLDWTKDHKNGMLVIWGHDPRPEVEIIKDTINIDQGGFCGHYLTMLRYPEMEILQEKIKKSYVSEEKNSILKQLANRFEAPSIQKYLENFEINTPYGKITIDSKGVKDAIEIVSTRTVPFEELNYVAPTMSPTPETSKLDDYLEHPNEAFEYYRSKDAGKVIVQKKHMGSRAIVTLFKNEQVGKQYFNRETLGNIVSRNNIRFFDEEQEKIVVEKLVNDFNKHALFEKYDTEMIVIDCEILPWNLKASGLIRKQYGLTSNAAIYAREKQFEYITRFSAVNNTAWDEVKKANDKYINATKFHKAFTNYCWDTSDLDGIQIAPFHILAFSKKTNFNEDHEWHMGVSKEMSKMSNLIIETPYKIINLDNEDEINDAIQWWIETTENGHEGFVMKPLNFIQTDQNGNLIQPAIKVRGREYLRIIYGMDYLEPDNLSRLKKRSASKKMRNAIKQFILSMESMNRFVKKSKVDKIHECILASLSIDSEIIDPRL